jgi:spermidine synthase
MAFWYDETFEGKTRYGCLVEEVLFREQSEFQLIEVLDTVHYGPTLVLDGIFMTSVKEEHFYHEMLVQPAMATTPDLRRALIIGGGDGGTAREILRHPELEQLVLVEIDPLVIEACRQHLPTIGTAWNDPRLEVIVGDGVAYVRDDDLPPFDLIFLDGCDPVGPAAGLFDIAFYRNCLSRLAEHGTFVAQTESPILQREVFLEIIGTLRQVFPRVRPYFGPAPLYAADQWSWTFCSRDVDHLAIREERARIIEPQMKYYNREIHRAAFAQPTELKRILAAKEAK